MTKEAAHRAGVATYLERRNSRDELAAGNRVEMTEVVRTDAMGEEHVERVPSALPTARSWGDRLLSSLSTGSSFVSEGSGANEDLGAGDLSDADARQHRQTLIHIASIAHKRRLFHKRKQLEDWTCVLAAFGVLVVQLGFVISLEDSDMADFVIAPSARIKPAGLTYLITISTVPLLVLCVWRYDMELRLGILTHRYRASATLLSTPGLWRWMLVEMLLLGAHVPAGMDFHFSTVNTSVVLSDGTKGATFSYHVECLNVVLWVRVYLLAIALRNHSGFYTEHLAHYGTKNNVNLRSPLLHFKYMFRYAPRRLLGTAIVIIILATTISSMVAESPVNEDFRSVKNAIYVCMVTMSTVGYGDISPVTMMGRTAIITGCVAGGVVLLALLTASFVDMVDLTQGESRVLAYTTQLRWHTGMYHWSLLSIQRTWRVRRARKQGTLTEQEMSHLEDDMYEALNMIRGFVFSKPDQESFQERDPLLARHQAVMDRVERVELTVNDTATRVFKIEASLRRLERALLSRRRSSSRRVSIEGSDSDVELDTSPPPAPLSPRAPPSPLNGPR